MLPKKHFEQNIRNKVVLAMAIVKGLSLQKMDINNTFLDGDLDKEVYVALPPSFHSKGWQLLLLQFLNLIKACMD